jgi:hypothetical protein
MSITLLRLFRHINVWNNEECKIAKILSLKRSVHSDALSDLFTEIISIVSISGKFLQTKYILSLKSWHIVGNPWHTVSQRTTQWHAAHSCVTIEQSIPTKFKSRRDPAAPSFAFFCRPVSVVLAVFIKCKYHKFLLMANYFDSDCNVGNNLENTFCSSL